MATSYLSPGVYVEEVDRGSKPIEAVGTNTVGFLGESAKGPLNEAVDRLEWTTGVGPKLKQMLRRGVGVHHAGMLPKYRRAVEDLFVKKLLAVVVCTETLAAGINLPARSVVLSSLVKGPRGKEKLIAVLTATIMIIVDREGVSD